ncbi:hypothetical protein DSO57_1030805 [Entomophthora muscae]|uniref:Uncharacterized protein n=1 Tax=Entomophthora muscae TaxID=34485 RepID=A0ACC2TMQ7_9FUNG|nr:hypothetical protein DSO57_1030805 [Entomophthora muscae]
MLEIPPTPPLPTVPPAQDFSKLGFVFITVLGLANQVVPHTGSWCPLATTVNYLIRIAPIVYMAFQAWPASPVGVQLYSGMGCDSTQQHSNNAHVVYCGCGYPRRSKNRLSATQVPTQEGDRGEFNSDAALTQSVQGAQASRVRSINPWVPKLT